MRTSIPIVAAALGLIGCPEQTLEPIELEVDLDHGEDVRVVVRYQDALTHFLMLPF